MEYPIIENEYVFLKNADIVQTLPDKGFNDQTILSNGIVASELFKNKYEELSSYDYELSNFIQNKICISVDNLCIELSNTNSRLSNTVTALNELSDTVNSVCTDLSVEISSIWADIKGGVNYKGHITINNAIINDEPVNLSSIFVRYLNITPDQAPTYKLNNGWLYNITLNQTITHVSAYTTKDGITLENNDYIIIHNHGDSSVTVNNICRDTIDIIESLQDDYVRLNILNAHVNDLNKKINEKIWLQNPDSPELVNGAYSDLSVVKLTKQDYDKQAIDRQLSEKTVYITSSDYIDAYGQAIKHLVMSKQTFGDASEAVNEKCLSLSINTLSNVITKAYSDADAELLGLIQSNYDSQNTALSGISVFLSNEISGNDIDISILQKNTNTISGNLEQEMMRNLDAVHYKGDLLSNNMTVLTAFMHDNFGKNDQFEFKRGFMYRFQTKTTLKTESEPEHIFNENDYVIFNKDVVLEDMKLSDWTVIKDYDSDIASVNKQAVELNKAVNDRIDETNLNVDRLSNEVSSKIWIKNPDSPALSDGDYSDLSVVKLPKSKYIELLRSKQISEKTIYVVQSNFIDAYNQVISNLVMPGQTSVDTSVAATKKYVDRQVSLAKAAAQLSAQRVQDALNVSVDTLNNKVLNLDGRITSNDGDIEQLSTDLSDVSAMLCSEIRFGYDSMHFKGNIANQPENSTECWLSAVLKMTITENLGEDILHRGDTFRFNQKYTLRDGINNKFAVEPNDYLIVVNPKTFNEICLDDVCFVKDYSSEIDVTVSNISTMLSNDLSTLRTYDLPKLSNDLSSQISSILTANLPEMQRNLCSMISSKIWIKSADLEELKDGAYSDLSVVKLNKTDYENLDRVHQLSERTIYIVSSDCIDAYGQPVKNIRMSDQFKTEVSEAVNVTYAKQMSVDLISNIENEFYKKTEIDQRNYTTSSDFKLDISKDDGGITRIYLKNKKNDILADVVATDFVTDGMLSKVELIEKTLRLTWNADAGNVTTDINLSDLIDVYTSGTGIVIENNKIGLDAQYSECPQKIQTITDNVTGIQQSIAGINASLESYTEAVGNIGQLATAVTQLDETVTNQANRYIQLSGDVKTIFETLDDTIDNVNIISDFTVLAKQYLNTLSTDGIGLSIYADKLSVDVIDVESAHMSRISANDIMAVSAATSSISAIDITANTISTLSFDVSAISAADITALSASVSSISAVDVVADTISALSADVSSISAVDVVADTISALSASVSSLLSTNDMIIDGYLLVNGQLSIKFEGEIYGIRPKTISINDEEISVLTLIAS